MALMQATRSSGSEDSVLGVRQKTALVIGVDEVTRAVSKQLELERQESSQLSQLLRTLVGTGDSLVGDAGFEVAVRLCVALEEKLQALLEGRDGLKLFAALRHVSPRLWARAQDADGVHRAARHTAEIAVHRYATWPDRVRLPYGLPKWSPQFLPRVAAVLASAEAFANTLSVRRRIAKGQVAHIRSVSPLLFDCVDARAGLDRLIAIRDERAVRDRNLLASLGGVLTPSGGSIVPLEEQRIIAVEWVDPAEYLAALESGRLPMEHMGDGAVIPLFERICRQGFISDVDARRVQLFDLDEALRPAFGFGVADLDAVMECLTNKVLDLWRVPPRTLDYHGFVVMPPPSEEDLLSMLALDRYSTEPPEPLTLTSMRAALAYLDAGRTDVELTQPLQQRPLRHMGNALLYDAANVVVGRSLWDAPLPEAARRRMTYAFEDRVHAPLAKFGHQPWASGKIIKVAGKSFTDVDASVVAGSTLVVVDCYGSLWSSALDEGSHRETRNRAERLVEKLRKWDQQWSVLALDHPDLFPEGVNTVLPVVVTASAEWLHLEDSELWFTEKVPRICTIGELSRVLESGVRSGTAALIRLNS